MRILLNYLRRRRVRLENDLDRELQYHIDRRVDELLANGMSELEAKRRANLEIGGIPEVREAVRETWTWPTLDGLALDFRYATRSLVKSRGFTLGAGAVLALTIGASTAIFSVVSTVLLQPLPYPDADRIVSIETFFTNTGQSSPMVSAPDFLDWQTRNDVFEGMAVFSSGRDFATRVDGRGTFTNPRFVSAGFFSVFGQAVVAGRLLTDEDIPAARADPTTAVVAYPWAVAHFGSAEAAVGQVFAMENLTLEVVGVAAQGFRYPGSTDFWIPFNSELPPDVPDDVLSAQRSNYAYQAVAKLGPGVPLTRAESQMRAIGDDLARQYPENRLKTVTLTPLQARLTGAVRVTL